MIVFFDGECGVCNTAVQWIFNHNPKRNIYFCALQSGAAKDFFGDHHESLTALDALVCYSDGTTYHSSDAVLKIAYTLGGIYRLCSYFSITPQFFRNALYRFIAKRRNKWNSTLVCKMPDAELHSQFVHNVQEIRNVVKYSNASLH
ncbi:MAG: thiol-disulfide oxidoreductase DCC family protein [Bacilli bacterium]